MEPYRYYCDLVNEIELLEYQLNICVVERMDWGFHGRLGRTVRMDQAAIRMDELSVKIERLSRELEKRRTYKKHIEHKLNQFKAPEYQVAYSRIVKNQTLGEIAADLGYSIDYVKRISANVTEVLRTVHF